MTNAERAKRRKAMVAAVKAGKYRTATEAAQAHGLYTSTGSRYLRADLGPEYANKYFGEEVKGGRPKGAKDRKLTRQQLVELMLPHVPRVVDKLMAVIEAPESQAVLVKAVGVFFDRVAGRPVQAVEELEAMGDGHAWVALAKELREDEAE